MIWVLWYSHNYCWNKHLCWIWHFGYCHIFGKWITQAEFAGWCIPYVCFELINGLRLICKNLRFKIVLKPKTHVQIYVSVLPERFNWNVGMLKMFNYCYLSTVLATVENWKIYRRASRVIVLQLSLTKTNVKKKLNCIQDLLLIFVYILKNRVFRRSRHVEHKNISLLKWQYIVLLFFYWFLFA